MSVLLRLETSKCKHGQKEVRTSVSKIELVNNHINLLLLQCVRAIKYWQSNKLSLRSLKIHTVNTSKILQEPVEMKRSIFSKIMLGK